MSCDMQAPAVALFASFIELKLNAADLLQHTKRPMPESAQGLFDAGDHCVKFCKKTLH